MRHLFIMNPHAGKYDRSQEMLEKVRFTMAGRREKWEAVYATLPETVLADLRYHSAYWDQFEGLTAQVSQQIYDTTLRSYGQTDGIQSYGTVVDLLTVYYRDAALEA